MKRQEMNEEFRKQWLETLSESERASVEQMSTEEETDLYCWWLEDQLKNKSL